MNVNESTSANQSASADTQTSVSSNDTTEGMSSMFMELLVAQIKNQDPLNPTDGTEYVSQLAQLSQVQSMESMSSQLTTSATLAASEQKLSASALVGQHVMLQTSTLQSDGESAVDGRLTLDHSANTVNLMIKDSAGQQTQVNLGAQNAGQVNFSLDPQALGLSAGQYSLSVVTDTEETGIPLEFGGVVNHVRMPLDGSSPQLNISGVGDVDMSNLTQVGEVSAA